MFDHRLTLTKSTLSSANQWNDLRKSRTVNRATNLGLKSSLKTVKAKHVSVTAYHDLSIRCSNSAALNSPKNTFRISFPIRKTNMNACMYIT